MPLPGTCAGAARAGCRAQEDQVRTRARTRARPGPFDERAQAWRRGPPSEPLRFRRNLDPKSTIAKLLSEKELYDTQLRGFSAGMVFTRGGGRPIDATSVHHRANP